MKLCDVMNSGGPDSSCAGDQKEYQKVSVIHEQLGGMTAGLTSRVRCVTRVLKTALGLRFGYLSSLVSACVFFVISLPRQFESRH